MRNSLRTSWGKLVRNLSIVGPLPTTNVLDATNAVDIYPVLSAVTRCLYQPFSTTQKQSLHLLNGKFYPSSTGPITITTKYINLLLVNYAGA